MSQRLPVPGSDDGTWGDILNGFLEVSHNPDGTLTPSAVSAAGAYSKPAGGIPGSDLAGTLQAKLAAAATGSSRVATTTDLINTGDHIVLYDASVAPFTATLPSAVGFSGVLWLKIVSTNLNIVTVVTTAAQTIDGAPSIALGIYDSGAPYLSATLISDNANWYVV